MFELARLVRLRSPVPALAPAARHRLSLGPAQLRHTPSANWKARCAARSSLRLSGFHAFFPESWPTDRLTSSPAPGSLRLRPFLGSESAQEKGRHSVHASSQIR